MKLSLNGTDVSSKLKLVTVQSVGTLAGDFLATSALSRVSEQLFDQMDTWPAAIAKDTAGATQAEKVVRSKPAALVDSCCGTALTKFTDAATCTQMFPNHNDPRLVAGAPATDDVFKCV